MQFENMEFVACASPSGLRQQPLKGEVGQEH